MIYYGCSQPRELWFIDFNHVHVHAAIIVVGKVMTIVLLCESVQQYRALLMILQYHKTLSVVAISIIFYDAPNALFCVFETSMVLSPVLFRQSLYFPFQFTEFAIYLYNTQYTASSDAVPLFP